MLLLTCDVKCDSEINHGFFLNKRHYFSSYLIIERSEAFTPVTLRPGSIGLEVWCRPYHVATQCYRYLNQWRPNMVTHICVIPLTWINYTCVFVLSFAAVTMQYGTVQSNFLKTRLLCFKKNLQKTIRSSPSRAWNGVSLISSVSQVCILRFPLLSET